MAVCPPGFRPLLRAAMAFSLAATPPHQMSSHINEGSPMAAAKRQPSADATTTHTLDAAVCPPGFRPLLRAAMAFSLAATPPHQTTSHIDKAKGHRAIDVPAPLRPVPCLSCAEGNNTSSAARPLHAKNSERFQGTANGPGVWFPPSIRSNVPRRTSPLRSRSMAPHPIPCLP